MKTYKIDIKLELHNDLEMEEVIMIIRSGLEYSKLKCNKLVAKIEQITEL